MPLRFRGSINCNGKYLLFSMWIYAYRQYHIRRRCLRGEGYNHEILVQGSALALGLTKLYFAKFIFTKDFTTNVYLVFLISNQYGWMRSYLTKLDYIFNSTIIRWPENRCDLCIFWWTMKILYFDLLYPITLAICIQNVFRCLF